VTTHGRWGGLLVFTPRAKKVNVTGKPTSESNQNLEHVGKKNLEFSPCIRIVVTICINELGVLFAC